MHASELPLVKCPICGTSCESAGQEIVAVTCKACGDYTISYEGVADISELSAASPNSRATLRYALAKMHQRELRPHISLPHMEMLLKTVQLPGLAEQLDNLIVWLARTSKGFGMPTVAIAFQALGPVGARDQAGLNFVIDHAIEKGWVTARRTGVMTHSGHSVIFQDADLTFDGWEHYDQLQRGAANSRLAFMAMQFGDSETDRIYRDFFKRAVAQTGFELRRNDEEQRAGLIDDLMRVQIRQSRFVISDLTHHNNGAYWEAGYAEGLGKPVIYTCHEEHFNDPHRGAHFDTNHHLTVLWNPDNMAPAIEKLKATIRATLPEDASLQDVPTQPDRP